MTASRGGESQSNVPTQSEKTEMIIMKMDKKQMIENFEMTDQ